MASLSWGTAVLWDADSDEHLGVSIGMTKAGAPRVTVYVQWPSTLSQANYETQVLNVIAGLQAIGYGSPVLDRNGQANQQITYNP